MPDTLRHALAGLAGAGALLLTGCQTTGTSGDLETVLGEVLGPQEGTAAGPDLSAYEVEAGLREALTVGTRRVADQLGRQDGYFGDPEIRIPLPGQLGKLQSNLSRVGLSQPLDDLQLRLNRAAEAAVPQARELVIDAVSTITLEDAVAILNGPDTAATEYLRSRTEADLRAALTPYMDEALRESGAFAQLDTIARNNGLGVLAADLGDDLTRRAVNYGLDGLFLYVAREEERIRENPVARTTDILRKVFGAGS
ncbi:MAG: DUF4197 family protein [Alphaproteobacteria bacterium]|jgi:hypothetical protein|nr:DUF4197 family protein [Alphaproteobacteria bacterium]